MIYACTLLSLLRPAAWVTLSCCLSSSTDQIVWNMTGRKSNQGKTLLAATIASVSKWQLRVYGRRAIRVTGCAGGVSIDRSRLFSSVGAAFVRILVHYI